MGRRPAPAGAVHAPEKPAKALRILHLEDSTTDAELAQRELERANIAVEITVVRTERDFRRGLAQLEPQEITRRER